MRAAMLTRSGFALGWLSEDEAWDTLALINHAADALFLVGRRPGAYRLGHGCGRPGPKEAADDMHDRARAARTCWQARPVEVLSRMPRSLSPASSCDAVPPSVACRCSPSATGGKPRPGAGAGRAGALAHSGDGRKTHRPLTRRELPARPDPATASSHSDPRTHAKP